ncbi:unnamed protein product [Cochlearia groenlandica]
MNEHSKLMNPSHRMNPPPPTQIQPRIMNQAPLLSQTQGMNHPMMVAMNQQPQVMMSNQQPQPLMMNSRGFNSLSSEYQNQPSKFGSKTIRNHWKRKKMTSDNKRPHVIRMHNSGAPPMYNHQQVQGSNGGVKIGPVGSGGYKPPPLNELQSQNRLKTRKFYPKRNHNGGNRSSYVPYAPRNTTSFIIRAKKSGGISELVSPCPVTPAVLPTPVFSPSREVLGDMAKEEWGVDGYGSMKGLIRLRSDGHDLETCDEDDEDEGGSSESDVEEHVEVERRLDHDLSRFEMIYPSYGVGGSEYNNVLENRVDDQNSHIAQLEEENLTLKERLFLMERELGDLRRRLQYLERRDLVAGDVNEEVVENETESDGDDDDTGGSDARTSGDTKENRVAAEDICMQDVAVEEAKEKKHTIGMKSSQGKEQVENDYEKVSGGQCEEANRVMVGMDQSKDNEMGIENLEKCI